MKEEFINDTVHHYLKQLKGEGGAFEKVDPSHNSGHHLRIKAHVQPGLANIWDVATNNFPTGGTITGGTITGGSLRPPSGIPTVASINPDLEEPWQKGRKNHFGGSFAAGVDFPDDRVSMYHMLLQMNPHQLELIREIAAQLLGAVPSPMWGHLTGEKEALEAPAAEYEHIIRMPNVHAAARMLDADHAMGGGFAKALRHVGKIAKKVYHGAKGVLGFVNRNKDLVMNLVPEEYKAGAESILGEANRWNEATSPFIDATTAAFKPNASQAEKDKFQSMASKAVEENLRKYAPESGKYIDVAKQAHKEYKENRESHFKHRDPNAV